MKNLRPVLFLFFVLLLAGSGFSQRKFAGKAVDVLDGRTVVIDLETGKLTAVIQYIEVPEPEQPLHQVAREHLRKLVQGKFVDFQPQGIVPKKTFGQLYLNGVDIGQQMVRDGAAWHAPAAKTGQGAVESTAYDSNQAQAKAEKRGIWSIPDLKPAWQFRAERYESMRRQEQLLLEKSFVNTGGTQTALKGSAKPANRVPGTWGDANPALKNVGALMNGYNAKTKTGYIGTSLLGVDDKDKEGEQTKTAVDITYVYKENGRTGRKGIFVVSVESISREWRFLKFSDLVVMADETKIVVGKAKRSTFRDSDMVRERLTYEVKRDTIEKIANGREVVIKVGEYVIRPENQALQLLLYNMLQVAE